MTNAVVPVRRSRRKPPAQVGNVVPLHKPQPSTEEIVAEVRGRSRERDADLTRRLQDAVAALQQRHRDHVMAEAVPLGIAMDRSTLDDWLEIGRRMLGGRA